MCVSAFVLWFFKCYLNASMVCNHFPPFGNAPAHFLAPSVTAKILPHGHATGWHWSPGFHDCRQCFRSSSAGTLWQFVLTLLNSVPGACCLQGLFNVRGQIPLSRSGSFDFSKPLPVGCAQGFGALQRYRLVGREVSLGTHLGDDGPRLGRCRQRVEGGGGSAVEEP